ncbi:DoxX family protein [Flavobacteriaceae bacterium]|jgi:hypothetical protein|nr:DoxX family protein [Flavobacteriaceae bacterium]|tara:strand:+ start:9279 stop:9665 length:387 start_codon:yes stop_codon:yes gene_type:complete
MIPEKIAFLFVLTFFLIVFIQSGLDKVYDYKGNLSFLNTLLGGVFSSSLITLALVSVTILELTSGLLCLLGILDVIYNDSNLTGLIGLIVGSFALLVLLFGQRVSKNYDGAKTIAVYFILAVIGLSLA